jgi:hypothetical protein
MRDPYLLLITSIMCYPNKPLKFYLDAAKVSRGTFFKVKGHLEALGIISLGDRKHLVVDLEKGQRFLDAAYPGLPIELGALPHSGMGSSNPAPTENKHNSVAG